MTMMTAAVALLADVFKKERLKEAKKELEREIRSRRSDLIEIVVELAETLGFKFSRMERKGLEMFIKGFKRK